MALSTPGASSRNKPIPSGAFEKTPNKSHFSNARSNYATPKVKRLESVPTTPDCFNIVQVETPVIKRRSSKDKFDEVSNLTVAVRIRPMNTKELVIVGATDVVSVQNQDLIIRAQNSNNSLNTDHIFQYDHIFWSCDESSDVYASQEDLFVTLGKPLINSAFRGYNGCLFAYGQTGSGKSFSMMGKNMCEAIDIDCHLFSGITPRFCRDIFDRISQLNSNCICTVEVSYFEIYNEKIHDLLSDNINTNKTPLKVREHPELGPYVVDLSIQVVKSYKDLRKWLLIGNKNRATAATTMNEKSSRSHSIFSIELCLSDDKNGESASRRSRISLVDLAGSERLGNSHSTEDKIREGVHINKSLLTLGKVISALADQKKNHFVPYRESVLTWLLRESLGGNSLTTMLATISPSSTHLDETLATLRYACQARSIVNRARVNENPHDKLIRELRCEVERLRALRQDFERSSLSTSSLTSCNDEELDELRKKLSDSERHLEEAQKNWEKRFLETKESQLKELAEAEKYKAELESKVRIMKKIDSNVSLSPYRTNFLEELEGVLTQETNSCDSDLVEVLKNWCHKNGLTCTLSSGNLIIKDPIRNKQSSISTNSISMKGYENINDFVNHLKWTDCKNINKNDVIASMNQIYQALASLQPPENENNLCLLFAKVNKTLQSFEAALMNNVKNNGCQKVVTFNTDV